MDYFDALEFIAHPIRASNLPTSLDHMQKLLTALGNPQNAFPCVVVAGSVGKGTTCHQIAAQMNPRLRVGLYTSPHLHSFRERFSINGEMISQDAFAKGIAALVTSLTQIQHPYSTFEMATALALWWFRQQAVDIAVLEIGIGGRYDAVNVVPNVIGVITPIEREHAAMLGGSLNSIARHKAGIIQPNGHVISAPQLSEIEMVIEDEAYKQDAALSFVPVEQLAITACNNLMRRHLIPTYALPESAPSVNIPGRLEQVSIGDKTVLIDGAHTQASAHRLRHEIDRIAPTTPVQLIIGVLRDKAAQLILEGFDDQRFHIVLTETASHRTLRADELKQSTQLKHALVTVQANLWAAIGDALSGQAELIVITGSLRMAALSRELLGLLDHAQLDEAQRTRTIFEGASYLSKLG